jgi:hypothetical protein
MTDTIVHPDTPTRCRIDPEQRIVRLDNTALDLWRKCPSKFNNRIVKDLVKDEEAKAEYPSLALHYGQAWHTAIDALYHTGKLEDALCAWEGASEGMEEDTYNKRTVGRGLHDLELYANTYSEELKSMDVIENEALISGPLVQIDTGDGPPWTVLYTGAIDHILRTNNKPRIRDHKTTTGRTLLAGSSYALANQMIGYAWLAQEFFGIEPPVILDVDIVILAGVRKTEFLRPEFLYDAEKIIEWKKNVEQTVRMILSCYETDIWPQYGREPCIAWNKECEFFQLCDAHPNIRKRVEESFYTSKPWDPSQRGGGDTGARRNGGA